ncbi:MAG: tetratricopeptide repeat protein, partial [Hyphomonadaceae bacterium]
VLELLRASGHASAKSLRRRDRRSPVVLLRSFRDDGLTVVEVDVEKQNERELEQTIAVQAMRFGPFITIGRPGELRRGTAARDYFRMDAWQDSARQWMSDARLIVIVLGETPGLEWELRTALLDGHAGKLIMVAPPSFKGGDAHRRWQSAAATFADTPWQAAAEQADLSNALAVVLAPDGRILIIEALRRERNRLELAFNIAAWSLLSRAVERLPISLAPPADQQRAASEDVIVSSELAELKNLARSGEPNAQYRYAAKLWNGDEIPKDEAAAVVWFRKAAQQRDADAENMLGIAYAAGRGVPQDHSEAAAWYRKSAKRGTSVAQYNLAACLENGKGAEKDEAEAAYWYGKAAESGDADAMLRLGRMLENGRGVKRNARAALDWYRRATKAGNTAALEDERRLSGAKPRSS